MFPYLPKGCMLEPAAGKGVFMQMGKADEGTRELIDWLSGKEGHSASFNEAAAFLKERCPELGEHRNWLVLIAISARKQGRLLEVREASQQFLLAPETPGEGRGTHPRPERNCKADKRRGAGPHRFDEIPEQKLNVPQ